MLQLQIDYQSIFHLNTHNSPWKYIKKIVSHTSDHNWVTGSTCQQLYPAQLSLCELSQTGLLWTDVPWPAMSSLAKFPTPPAKETHIQLTMHPGKKTQLSWRSCSDKEKDNKLKLVLFFSFINIQLIKKKFVFLQKKSTFTVVCHQLNPQIIM